MSSHLVAPTAHGSGATELRERLAEKLHAGELFWLDLHDPSPADIDLLRDPFGFHQLAIEDSEHFGQRPKVEDFDDFAFLVVYGWSPDEDGLVEVHCFYAERSLVTVHRDASPTLDALREKLERDPAGFPANPLLLHKVIDHLVDDLFPAVEQLNEDLDVIEERMFAAPRREQLEDIFRMKHRLAQFRRVVVPQRDLVGRLSGDGLELPGMTSEAERYFRHVYDHLVRLAEEVEVGRERTNAATDAYVSTSSNRLNATTKQLTVIATIFLPLSFLTGFFGQNFAWMVDHVDSWQMFVALGLGLEVVTLIALLAFFRLRGWF